LFRVRPTKYFGQQFPKRIAGTLAGGEEEVNE
jgi:hypothetical protein